jgi:hypothetical protein
MPFNVDSIVGVIPQAITRLTGKTPVASAARTAEWERVPLALRERAFWSAGVADIQTVSSMRAKLDEWADFAARRPDRAFMGKSKFIAEMRGELGAAEGDSGSLTDITSANRLGLVYDFNTTQAAEYARYVVGSDPDVLDGFPAQELIRVEQRKEPRDWVARWQGAGGQLYGGRMIALKTDDIWTRISAFGTPFPPFDFGSGMGLADVERDEAAALGVIPADYRPPGKSPLEDFNAKVEASISGLSDDGRANLKAMFGDQVVIDGDKVQWQGNIIGDLYNETLAWDAAGRLNQGKPTGISLGQATNKTIEMARPYLDIGNSDLWIGPDQIAHAIDRHGVETRGGQRSLTRLDFELIPHVWRSPDEIVRGTKGRSIELRKELIGRQAVIGYQMFPNQRRLFVYTLWVKEGGQ